MSHNSKYIFSADVTNIVLSTTCPVVPLRYISNWSSDCGKRGEGVGSKPSFLDNSVDGGGMEPLQPGTEAGVFDSLLDDAGLAEDWGEHCPALQLYQQLLEAAPEDLSSSALASILETIDGLQRALESWRDNVNRARTDVLFSPLNPVARLELGSLLISFGRNAEAIQHFRAAMPLLETVDPWCRAGCFERTACYHFRQGEYCQAHDWFDKATKVEAGNDPVAPRAIRAALERKALTCCRLGWESEARGLASSYVSTYGRLSRPVRKALQKLNVDADAMFIAKLNPVV